MQYFSTNRKSAHVSFQTAVLNGQPPDRGLYFPAAIPTLSAEFWNDFSDNSQERIAFEVIKPYVGGEIPDDALLQICRETVDFDFPLVEITDKIAALELFHGATLAFKDVGARFMSRCLQHFSAGKSAKTIVIVATSGDTGGAVAGGFYEAENTEVVILYPRGKVSRVQELQLTTLGKNISALEVEGTFDDCQTLAKTALADQDLKEKVFLTSANSINVARWLPQQFYYFYAVRQWREKLRMTNDESRIKNSELRDPQSKIRNPVVCVPSGNFGNVCAGTLARASGLPVGKFIAATNANDVVPNFLKSGEMKTKSSVSTVSNAMDVGDPSNFVRISEIFGNDFSTLKENLTATSVSDAATIATMRRVYEKYDYILDPHGAVGFCALENYLRENPSEAGFFLETAHPVKFDSVEKIIGTFGAMPASIEDLFARSSHKIEMKANYDDLKEILLQKI